MKSIKNQYPVYLPDQFLTSDNLNESFGFLECHERVTRSMIIGQGIIDGLDYSYTTTGTKVKSVDIKSGYGSSKDGYFLFLPEESVADKTQNYQYSMNWLIPAKIFDPLAADDKTVPALRLLTEGDLKVPELKEAAKLIDITESDLLGKYRLALFADIKVTKLGNCSPGNCNIKGEEDSINTIVLLIDIATANFAKINPAFSALPGLMLLGLNKISSFANKSDFKNRVTTIAVHNLGLISEKMKDISEASAVLITTESNRLKSAMNKLNDIIKNIGAATDIIEYYLLFANDLQLAINEYILHYNNFISKYYTTDEVPRFNRMLVLGQFQAASPDPYRYLWTSPLSSRDRRASYFIMANLCKRIAVLISHFTEAKALDTLLGQYYGTKAETRLKLIPDKGYSFKLGDRSVPYYYDVLKNGFELLNQSWRTQDLDNRTDLVFNYFDDINSSRKHFALPFTFNLSEFPFFRIEGHIGLETEDASATLQSMIKKLDIPLQVITVELENQRWSGFREKYDGFIKKYELFYQDLIATRYAKDPDSQSLHEGFIRKFKEMRTNINEVSYRNLDTVKTMLNDINAYGRMFAGSEPSKAARKKVNVVVDGAAPAVTAKLTNGIYTGTVANNIKQKLKDRDILKVRDELLKDYPTLIESGYSVKELKGLEYLGGAYKGGTIVLVSDGAKIIGDFSLPFYHEKN